MATSPQQIGWSQESKLLWQLKQIVAKYGKTSAYKAYPSLASFPLPGSPNTLYLALDTSKIYYWDETTSSYIEVSAGITSVGLTMPAAFAVANSPLTANGTINVTGAGLISQYVRGDGSLSDFPGSTGGGASVNYYFNGGTSQGVFGGDTYYEMSKVADTGAAANFSISADGYVAQFLTDAGDPNLLQIPGGAWDIELYMNADSAGGTPNFYVELYKYDGVTFTLLGSSSGNPEFITNGTSVDLYYTSVAVPTTTLLLTDRLAMRVYVNHSGKTITLYTQDNTLALVQTTFTSGLTAINGLTAQVQYLGTGTTGTDFNISSAGATHTFNIPTASATNRGLLSSADWTTFNNKPSVNLYTGDGTLTAARTVTLGGNNLVFEGGASVARLRLSANNNVARIFSFATANVARWAFRVDGNETGANSGGDFAIRRYNDAGTIIDAPISISRATGGVTMQSLAGGGTQFVSVNNAGLLSAVAAPTDTNIYNSDGTLTGNRTLTSGGFNLTFTGSNTASAGLGRLINFSPTLIASANSDTLVALDINPTFTNGAFTDVSNIGVRINDSYLVVSGDYFPTNTTITKGLVFEASGGIGRITSRFASANAQLRLLSSLLTIQSNTTITGNLTTNSAGNNFFQNLKLRYTTADAGGLQVSFGIGLSVNNDLILMGSTGQSLFVSAPTIRFTNQNTSTEYGRFFATTGNFILQNGGTFTDAGYRCDIQGTLRVTGNITLNGSNNLIDFATNDLQITNASSSNKNILIGKFPNPSTGTNNILISTGVNGVSTTSSRAVYIGWGNFAQGNNTVTIGEQNNVAAGIGFGNNNTVANGLMGIGSNNTVNAQNAIAIGVLNNNTGQETIIIGRNNVASGIRTINLGVSIVNTGTNNITLGLGAYNNQSNTFVAGGAVTGLNWAINNVYFGSGIQRDNVTTGVGADYTINGSGALGTDFAGGNITIAGGKGTGAGTAGDVIFATSTVLGSGTTLQSLTNRWFVKGTNGALSNVTSPNASAVLQIDSTTQGMLPPRMTSAQRVAIASPAEGLVVVQTDGTSGLYLYIGGVWRVVAVV